VRCSATGRAEFCRCDNGRVGCCMQTREHKMDSVMERIINNADDDDDDIQGVGPIVSDSK